MAPDRAYRMAERRPSSSRKGTLGVVADPAAPHEQRWLAAREHLRRFGVLDQDLDDLTQEVFLVLHAKRQVVDELVVLDPWLREVCRRVAAGHRRRAHRRHEISFGEPPERSADELFDRAIEQGEDEERLHRALARLDEKSLDLVALHELGNLPLIDVADLVRADRKTVSKRLGTALRRLTMLLRAEPGGSPPAARELRSPGAPHGTESFRILVEHPALNVGLMGSVVVAVWPGPATLEGLELLDVQFTRALEICKNGFAYLTVVEAATRPPNLAARQKIVSMLRAHAHHIRVYATALQGGAAWLARPIMTGLALLARPPFPMQFFNGVPAAARWLVEVHPQLTQASVSSVVECTERLRRTAPTSASNQQSEADHGDPDALD